jgi:hypothetical protein
MENISKTHFASVGLKTGWWLVLTAEYNGIKGMGGGEESIDEPRQCARWRGPALHTRGQAKWEIGCKGHLQLTRQHAPLRPRRRRAWDQPQPRSRREHLHGKADLRRKSSGSAITAV